MAATLDVRGLSVELSTRTGWVRPVNDVTFSLAQGETLGIVGESGSGKTKIATRPSTIVLRTSLPPRPRKCVGCAGAKSPWCFKSR